MDILKEEKILCMKFDNLINGGSNSFKESLCRGDSSFLATCVCSSEGEHIVTVKDTIKNMLEKKLNTLIIFFSV